ncbi:TetR/AcrR family transcriptional regulator [Desulfosporosinus fructosivorans]|uniref:TetR/AcrR family transcriptional regulator n=1 Tax=Desulfosporosinus fructosivorans TaxID=2018669 RepID=A0A4Z0R098_9FIRM|nr:TetR/AcrR family transcriptional regulator [Desulfosporosinus fructosivorans]TGE35613.1 TetR/AcrR family transcriptional regulator [Desulfosporosinus fructosivorans]
MGTTERKEKEKNIRREDIINAAEKIFFLKGYESSTMDEVAKIAEYTKKTLYSYFQSKEQLLQAIIFRAYWTLNKIINTELSDKINLTGLAKLKLLGETFIQFTSRYPKYFETLVLYNSANSELSADDEFRKASDNEGEITLAYLVNVIKEGVSDNSIRSDIHIQKTAFVLYANIIGISSLVLNKEGYLMEQHLSAKKLIQEMFNLIERSIEK